MSERILTLLAAVLAVLIAGVFLFWQPEIPDRVLPKANIAAGGISPCSRQVARFP